MSKSKSQKKAEKQIKKYYGEEKGFITQKAATETERLKQDVQTILADSGIATNRAIEDFVRNIGNLNANKATEIADLNEYVATSTQRTGEDLSTALAKESRRFGLESDKINTALADAGLTFSDRRPEKIAQGDNASNLVDINTSANRSFQDIARYEAAKNRDLQLKYGQSEAQLGVEKTRTLEDILNDQKKALTANTRTGEDVQTGLTKDLRDISYAQDTGLATTGQLFNTQKLQDKIDKLTNG